MPHIFYFQVYFLEFCSYLWNLGKAPLKHHPLCLCFHRFSHAEQIPISQGSYNILNLPLLFRSYNKSYNIIFWIYPCYLLSGSWWWTGEPGVLQSMGSQRVRDDWATELNWTEDCIRADIFKQGIESLRERNRERENFQNEIHKIEEYIQGAKRVLDDCILLGQSENRRRGTARITGGTGE